MEPQFSEAEQFTEGAARVMIGGTKYDWAEDYHSGKWGYIDKNGRWLAQPLFDDAEKFSAGLAAVGIGGKYGIGERYGYIDKGGNFVISPKTWDVLPFSEGLARVRVGGKWGLQSGDPGRCAFTRRATSAWRSPSWDSICGLRMRRDVDHRQRNRIPSCGRAGAHEAVPRISRDWLQSPIRVKKHC